MRTNFGNIFRPIAKQVSKYGPEIAVGVGIAGMITTTILAVKATPKSLRLIEAEKKRRNHEIKEEAKESGKDTVGLIDRLSILDTVKVAWKPYIPAMISGALSIGCIVGASTVHVKRNAALATAYQLAANTLSDYKEKVIETIGEEREKEVQKKVDAKKVEKINSTEPSFVRKGKPLCIEPISGRPFEMDLEDVKAAINRLNYRLTGGMEECISLSEWYDEIGLKHTDVSDYMGWNIYSDGLITVTEVPSSTDEGELCWVLEYAVLPHYKYEKTR
mgnify:FL=1|jgi:hypothetical protein